MEEEYMGVLLDKALNGVGVQVVEGDDDSNVLGE